MQTKCLLSLTSWRFKCQRSFTTTHLLPLVLLGGDIWCQLKVDAPLELHYLKIMTPTSYYEVAERSRRRRVKQISSVDGMILTTSPPEIVREERVAGSGGTSRRTKQIPSIDRTFATTTNTSTMIQEEPVTPGCRPHRVGEIAPLNGMLRMTSPAPKAHHEVTRDTQPTTSKGSHAELIRILRRAKRRLLLEHATQPARSSTVLDVAVLMIPEQAIPDQKKTTSPNDTTRFVVSTPCAKSPATASRAQAA
jgi:hypothetical protein